MNYVDEEKFLQKTLIKETLFNKKGEEIQNIKKNKAFAKISVDSTEAISKITHYVSVYLNVLYDPTGCYSNREQYLQTKLKKVSKETFDFYYLYLMTNNSIYFTRAQRKFLND